MPRREFVYREGTSNKFWSIAVEGSAFTVRFGRVGTAGQTQAKSFPTLAAAQAAADQLVAEKLRKGYVEVAAAAAVEPAPAATPEPSPAAGDETRGGDGEVEAVGRAWDRIEAWVAKTLPRAERGRALPGGASAAEIEQVERAVGASFPESVRASYRRHDGFAYAGTETLLSLAEVAREWKLRKQLLDAGTHVRRETAAGAGVRPVWWSAGWIPLTRDEGGNGACLDLDPAPRGQPGQVVDFAHGPERKRLARGFAEWLERIAARLAASRLRWSEDEGELEEVSAADERRNQVMTRGLELLTEHSWNTVFQVAASPDGRWVAIHAGEKGIGFDTQKGKRVSVLGRLGLGSLIGSSESLVGLAFAPDGRTLLLATATAVRHFDLTTGAKLASMRLPEGAIADAVGFGHGGAWAVTATREGRVVVHDLAKKRVIAQHEAQRFGRGEGYRVSVAIAPDGGRVFTPGAKRGAEVIEVATGTSRLLPGAPTPKGPAAFSPDGRRVAFRGTQSTVTLWDVDAGKRIWNLPGDEAWAPWSVAFSADGATVAVGDLKKLRIADAATGKVLAKFATEAAALAALPGGGGFLVGRQRGLLRCTTSLRGRS